MVLYLSTIFVCALAIFLLNVFVGKMYFDYSTLYILGAIVASIVFEILIDGLFAIIVKKLPNDWFSMDNRHFAVSKWQIRFFEKIKIRKWKDKVWDLGGLGGFKKDKIVSPNDPKYIEQFIIECNKGVTTHRIGYFVGFLVIFIFPLKYALAIGVPVALVNLFLNILPTMVLKYNTPKLIALYKRLVKQQMKSV